MSYRLAETPPTEGRGPRATMVDTARRCDIVVDNGTVTRTNIPCFYGRRMTRHDLMVWDHHGWPSPGRPDRSDYARVLRTRYIDLEDEGYDSATVVLGRDVDGLTVSADIDHCMVSVTIDAVCPDANEDNVTVDYALYVLGDNDDAGTLRDLVTKGTIRILASQVETDEPEPTPPTPGTTHTISYMANGGTGTMESQVVQNGDSVTISQNQFTREGYDFTTWNTQDDGQGTTIPEGFSFRPLTDYQLYAQWAEHEDPDPPTPGETYVITYNANGGQGYMDSQSVSAGSVVVLSTNMYERDGYDFASWNTQADGGGVVLPNNFAFVPRGDLTLYAQWDEIDPDPGPEPYHYTHTLSYDANGGEGTMTSQTAYGRRPVVIKENEFTNGTRRFFTWNTSPYGTGTTYYEGQPMIVSEDTTLYAIWRIG